MRYPKQRFLAIALAIGLLLLGGGFSAIAQGGTSNYGPVTTNLDWQIISTTDDLGAEVVVVPAGCFDMGTDERAADLMPATEICIEQDFVLDRFEVTNALADASGFTFGNPSQFTEPEQPRDSVTWFDANAFCASRTFQGQPMRLLTEAEWEYAARGPSHSIYPYGNEPELAVAVTRDNSGGTTQAVGTYPRGDSWVGAADMAGNVWEWTSSIYRPYPYSAGDGREDVNNTEESRVLRGASANNSIDQMYAANRFARNPGTGYAMIGFRCAADLRELIEREGPGLDFEPDIQTVSNVQMARVPAGCFAMGSDDERSGESGVDEMPVDEVCIENDFLIDVFEVTNANAEAAGFTFANPGEFTSPDNPRDTVTWTEANTYCAARGGRLPTEAEWEYAARGPSGGLYPWGETFGRDEVDFFIWRRNSTGQSLAIGSRPETDVSWVGAVDMAGNVAEWTSTIVAPYPYNANDGREEDGNLESRRIVRGVDYLSSDFPRMSLRKFLKPDESRDTVGFRCVVDLVQPIPPDTNICSAPTDAVTARLTVNEMTVLDTKEDEPARDDILVQYFFGVAGGNPIGEDLAQPVAIGDVVTDFETITVRADCSARLSMTLILREDDGVVPQITLADPHNNTVDLTTFDFTQLPITQSVSFTGQTANGQPFDYRVRYTIDIQSAD